MSEHEPIDLARRREELLAREDIAGHLVDILSFELFDEARAQFGDREPRSSSPPSG
jgi:hypothetical protein